jgi:hypothetical protein
MVPLVPAGTGPSSDWIVRARAMRRSSIKGRVTVLELAAIFSSRSRDVIRVFLNVEGR